MQKILNQIHNSNLELFLVSYKKNLETCIKKYPEEYACTLNSLDLVFDRMKHAIIKGSFNKDSKAFKMTCKELKIKHTYKDIETFIYSI